MTRICCPLTKLIRMDWCLFLKQETIWCSCGAGSSNFHNTSSEISSLQERAMQVFMPRINDCHLLLYQSISETSYSNVQPGHYVPQLARLIIRSKVNFNLKGIAVSRTQSNLFMLHLTFLFLLQVLNLISNVSIFLYDCRQEIHFWNSTPT